MPGSGAHAIAPGALATAESMPSGVRTCCTQRGQGSCAADPNVQLGSVARYLEKTAVVPLDSEYDAGMIFKLGILQAAQPSWPDVHDTACQ